jgi:PAS domain S-box-containing protein
MLPADTALLGAVLVAAPVGRDNIEILRILAASGVPARALGSLAEACDEMGNGADVAALVLTEEALAGNAGRLMDCLGRQPSWSDLPILVLTASRTQRGAATRRTLFEDLGNTTLLPRPLHADTLRSAVRAALRARSRQHETRRHLDALKQAAETLEARVVERTAELRASQARLRTLFETSNQGQGLIALDGRLLDTNSTFLKSTAARADEVVGRLFWEAPCFTATPGMPELIRQVVQLAAQGDSTQQEVALNLPAGPRSFDMSIRPMRNEEGAIAAVVLEAIDITDRRMAEEALRQSQKMEAVGQLTGGVAHDFNNLLTIILGSLEMLRRRMPRDVTMLRFVEAAETAARRGAQVNAQLLSFSRRQPLQAVDVDVRKVIEGIGDLLERTVSGAAVLTVSLPEEALPVHVDRNQLEMALLNLVVNARDASSAGGRILVQARRAVDGGGGGACISVTDEGAGMPPEVLNRAFEPFFTTKPPGAGTGLGLSMVYGFVRQSGGEIDIESAPGAGTQVRLRLPEGDPAALQASADATVEEIRPTQGESILVVEDDAAVRAIAVSALEQLGYPIHEAESGDDALRLLQDGLEVDLLFTDVAMPGSLDGVALAQRVHQNWPGIRILVTSGRLPQGVDLDAVRAVGGAFLPKPYQPIEIALAIQSILDGDDAMLASATTSRSPGSSLENTR